MERTKISPASPSVEEIPPVWLQHTAQMQNLEVWQNAFPREECAVSFMYNNAPHSFPTLLAAQEMHSLYETAVPGPAFVTEKML